MEELALLGERPRKGPVVIIESTGLPWNVYYFRHVWRTGADAAGIPKSVRNMDSRAGAITEATDAGADLEHVRHAAIHSAIKMTQRYSRGAADKSAEVARLRIQHRNRKERWTHCHTQPIDSVAGFFPVVKKRLGGNAIRPMA